MRSGDGLRSGAQGAAPQAATVASSSPSATVATISSSSSSPSDRKVKSPSLSSDEAVIPASMPIPGAAETKGWLYKWTNYIKGYQKRWFVLSNGLLSYYRYQAEMSHTCRLANGIFNNLFLESSHSAD